MVGYVIAVAEATRGCRVLKPVILREQTNTYLNRAISATEESDLEDLSKIRI